MKVATKINYEDVISFFESADLDLANLTHQLVTSKLNSRIEKKQEIGERLSKARKARKPRTEAVAATEAPATPEPVAEQAQPQAHTHPHRQTVSA